MDLRVDGSQAFGQHTVSRSLGQRMVEVLVFLGGMNEEVGQAIAQFGPAGFQAVKECVI